MQAKLEEQAAIIVQLTTQMNQLSDLNQQLHSQLSSTVEMNRQLTETIQVLTARLHGRKSEKTRGLMNGQLAIPGVFDEAEASQDEPVNEPEIYEPTEPTKKRKSKRTLREQFRNLPVEDVLYVMDEASKVCPECGEALKVVGTRQNRLEVQFIPAQVKLLNILQETCSCTACSKRRGQTVFVEPEIPAPVLPHSYASASSIAWTMYQKFVQAVPLYRQVKDWQSMGVDLNRGTLSNWILKTCDEWLYPLIRYLETELKKQSYLHADETPVQVLDEPGRKNTSKSYMWVFTTTKNSDKPIRIFTYKPTRSGDVPAAFFGDYDGYLVTDDYAGYNRLAKAKRALCWAHVRRKFTEVPVSKTGDQSTVAAQGITLCNRLFELEQAFAEMSPDVRLVARQKESRPVVEQFFRFVDENQGRILAKTQLGKALAYAKGNQSKLMTFLEDGQVELSNAVAENAIRPFAIGRKNWLFAGSPNGAKASACVYSLIETAKANGLDPFLYLQSLLQHIPGCNYITDPAVMSMLMPWHPHMQKTCKK